MKLLVLIFLTTCLSGSSQSMIGSGTINEELESMIMRGSDNKSYHVWVFFGDKGRYESATSVDPHAVVSSRSLLRRLKV